MSENIDREERDFSRFDSMSTEQLEEILRAEAHKPNNEESDTDELFYIMGVLADRRNNANNTGKTVEEAYATFKKHYMPHDGEQDIDIQTENVQTARSVRKPISWIRRTAAVAAVLAICTLAAVSADAMGLDVFGKVANWSKDFFHFADETQGTEATDPDKQSQMEYASLQEALDRMKITQKLAPTWLPDGYTLSNIEAVESPRTICITAKYKRDNKEIQVVIRQLLTSTPAQIEKSENCIEVYIADGITYYLLNNYDNLKAVWTVEAFECYISGELTIDEMKAIIDSI